MGKYLCAPLTMVKVAFGAVAAGYGASNLIAFATADNRRCTRVEMRNDCDHEVYITFDGVNDHFFIPASGELGLSDIRASDIRVRRAGSAPTSGQVCITPFLE